MIKDRARIFAALLDCLLVQLLHLPMQRKKVVVVQQRVSV